MARTTYLSGESLSGLDLSDTLNVEDAARQLDRALDFGGDADVVKWARRYARAAVERCREAAYAGGRYGR